MLSFSIDSGWNSDLNLLYIINFNPENLNPGGETQKDIQRITFEKAMLSTTFSSLENSIRNWNACCQVLLRWFKMNMRHKFDFESKNDAQCINKWRTILILQQFFLTFAHEMSDMLDVVLRKMHAFHICKYGIPLLYHAIQGKVGEKGNVGKFHYKIAYIVRLMRFSVLNRWKFQMKWRWGNE